MSMWHLVDPQCSRADCKAAPTQQVIWRNPNIHAPNRQKVWLACDEHAAFLHDYLASRAFPVRREPLGELPEPPTTAELA